HRVSANTLDIGPAPAKVNPHVAAINPPQFLQPLSKGGNPGRRFRIVRGDIQQHADAPHPLARLCPRCQRPPFGSFAKSVRTRSMSVILCTAAAVTVTPNDVEAASAVRTIATLADISGSCTNATRRTLGVISFSRSSHFPPISVSKF